MARVGCLSMMGLSIPGGGSRGSKREKVSRRIMTDHSMKEDLRMIKYMERG